MYEESGNFLQFFQPIITLAQNAAEVLKEIDIGAASGDHGEYICVKPCVLYRGQFTATSEAVSGTSVPPTVIMTKRPTPLSASSEVVAGTITVPSGMAIGKTCYKDISPVQFNVGDSLEISWTVGTGTPTGQGVFSALCAESAKSPGENSDLVASA